MAQVSPTTSVEIDRLLERSLASWESLPDIEREIGNWDLVDQLVFVEEWPIEEDRLQSLAELAERDELNREQCARYERLLQLAAKHRPIVERLLAT